MRSAGRTTHARSASGLTVNETKRWEINMLKRPLVIATIAATVAMTTFPTQASAQGDPLLGALVGAGIGAAIGHGVNGRNGA